MRNSFRISPSRTLPPEFQCAVKEKQVGLPFPMIATFLSKIAVAVIREEAKLNGWKFVERVVHLHSHFSLVHELSNCVLSATDVPDFGIKATRTTSDEMSGSLIDKLVRIGYQEFRLEESATRIILTSGALPPAEIFRCKACNRVLDYDFAIYGSFHVACWDQLVNTSAITAAHSVNSLQDDELVSKIAPHGTS